MWDEVVRLREEQFNRAWCFAGDFNSVRYLGERKGLNNAYVINNDMLRFNNFIERVEVLDIPMVGRKYTWYNPNGSAKSRIDRVMVSVE